MVPLSSRYVFLQKSCLLKDAISSSYVIHMSLIRLDSSLFQEELLYIQSYFRIDVYADLEE